MSGSPALASWWPSPAHAQSWRCNAPAAPQAQPPSIRSPWHPAHWLSSITRWSHPVGFARTPAGPPSHWLCRSACKSLCPASPNAPSANSQGSPGPIPVHLKAPIAPRLQTTSAARALGRHTPGHADTTLHQGSTGQTSVDPRWPPVPEMASVQGEHEHTGISGHHTPSVPAGHPGIRSQKQTHAFQSRWLRALAKARSEIPRTCPSPRRPVPSPSQAKLPKKLSSMTCCEQPRRLIKAPMRWAKGSLRLRAKALGC